MSLGHLVEELDDVGEVHVAVEDDVAVALDEAEGNEKEELLRGHLLRGPDRLPDSVDVVIGEFSLEVQEEPAVAEIEMGEVAVLLDLVVEGPVKDLHQCAHVRKVVVHLGAGGEVLDHPGHEGLEAGEDNNLIVEDDQQGGDQVAHALHVPDFQVLPNVSRHNIPQLVQIVLQLEVGDVAVASSDILVDPVQVDPKALEEVDAVGSPLTAGRGRAGRVARDHEQLSPIGAVLVRPHTEGSLEPRLGS